jgi:hypothetical protein
MANRGVRWRWVLPVCQVILAAALFYTAGLEKQVVFAESEVRDAARSPKPGEELTLGWQPVIWGYVPRSNQILTAIEFPVILAGAPLALLTGNQNVFYRALILVGVFLFWWWVGRWLDFRPAPMFKNRAIRIVIVSAGLLASMGLGVAIASSYWRHSFVYQAERLGAAAWCLVGIVVCATTLKRSLLPRL